MLVFGGDCATRPVNFTISGDNVPVVVTNKHVVNNNRKARVKFRLHIGDEKPESIANILADTEWVFHPGKDKDLCYAYAGPIFRHVLKESGRNVFQIGISDGVIPTQDELNNMDAVEDVVMVGYPNGLWDEKNNLPIFRRGITATHPAVDFNGDSIGVVDMACFPGSSGSPIMLVNNNPFINKSDNSLHIAESRTKLLGVLFAGPTMNLEGKIVIKEIPAKQELSVVTNAMINLGYYIKSSELLTLKGLVRKELKVRDKLKKKATK